MSEPTKYAEFVMPELSKSRLDAQWARILENRESRAGSGLWDRRRLGMAIPAAGLLVAVCAMGVLFWPRDDQTTAETSVWEGSTVSSDEATVEMTFAEGTHVQVEPHSEVKLLHSSPRAVQMRLAHGSARFEVAKKRERRFSVNLGKVEVVVTGTQFRVLRKESAAGERVTVQVTEGSVEVHRGDGGVVALHAGEKWSTLFAPQDELPQGDVPRGDVPRGDVPRGDMPRGDINEELAVGASATREDTQVEAAPQAEAVRPADEEVKPSAEPQAEEEEPSRDLDEEAQLEDDSRADSRDEAEDDRSQRTRARRAAARRRAVREAAVDAGELFDHANLARRAGRLEDAAELYADLVEQYPRDRRASLAAFELGRLRMDSLRDNRGAVAALERALKLDAHGAFAEDALARLVLAEEALGDRDGCGRARSRYLARYPEGVHAQHVAERCGGR